LTEPEIVDYLVRLTEPTLRREAARDLALYLGAKDLICFVHDPEIGVLLPAPGFPQTVPRGRLWRAFLSQCVGSGAHQGELPLPDTETMDRAVGVGLSDGSVAVLIGGAPDAESVESLRRLLPLVTAEFRAESGAMTAGSQAALDRKAATEAQVLTDALSAARHNFQRLASREAARRREAEEMALHIIEGTASVTGKDFFNSLVCHLAFALQVQFAFVAECRDNKRKARMLAFWKGRGHGENAEYDVAATPCRRVVEGQISHYPRDVQDIFPDDRDLVDLGAQSYLGLPLSTASGQVIGHLAVLDDKPMPERPQSLAVLKIFAARAGAELERHQAELNLRAALAEVERLKNRLQAENLYLQEEIRQEHDFEEIVGSSPALMDLLAQVERAAPTDSTVLLYGETGTGKELVARALHDRSKRRGRPLVKVNCGAISAGLVESELFGHVKGAFTGAIERRTGRFELANGGTLFLDEVGELPLETQVKLLRVLQEQEFEPLGSSRTVRVDVRVIAATNRNLAEAVAAGRLRCDLFYRLNVLPLTVPPLRERRSDIPQLVTYFLSRFATKFGKKVASVTQATMDQLVAYPWPGNIRELQNVLERAVVLSRGPTLVLGRDLLPAHAAAAVAAPSARPSQQPAHVTLEEVERGHILSVLATAGWVIEGPHGAAKILNLHPNTMRSRMSKLGIRRETHEMP